MNASKYNNPEIETANSHLPPSNSPKNLSFKPKTSQLGFTIVELLVVIVVIAILAAISFVAYSGISRRATEAVLQADLSNASKQIKLYQAEYGLYPTSLEPSTNCLRDALNNVDTRYCLKSSNGVSLSSYTVDNSSNPPTFSILATKSSIVYKVTAANSPFVYNVPSAPQSLTATANSSTQITLNWTVPASDGGSAITAYKVYRDTTSNPSTPTLIATLGNVLTYVNNTGLTNNTTYYYRVIASSNGTDYGTTSNEATIATLIGGIDGYT